MPKNTDTCCCPVSPDQILRVHEILFFSEGGKVSHYIINSKGSQYQIGENTFPDVHSIIDFYKKHFLDTTNLQEPVSHLLLLSLCIMYPVSMQ